jgi:DNA-binding MarR family transcriptional regulator
MTTDLAAGRPDRAAATSSTHRAPDPRLGAWRTFLHAHARLTRRLDEELREAHGLSLAEYDALVQLASTHGRRLRMSVLADRVLLSRSGITRLVDRLVADGMVERTACTTDARGAEALLTRTGLDRLRAASETHLDGVRRYFIEAIDGEDQAAIERGLGCVLDGLECPPGAGGAPGPSGATAPAGRASRD